MMFHEVMSKRTLFFLVYVLTFPILVFAQNQVSGKVFDHEENPLFFSNVMLLKAVDSSFVAGTIAEENGTFNLNEIMAGREFESSLTETEMINATVVFIDICSFTTISENEEPAVVVKLLNYYFDVMVKVIIAQGGYIDKFIGDAIMAVFKNDNHLVNAVEACLQVKAQIEMLPELSDHFTYKPKVSIGINCGEMISGNIGSVSLKRLDYTVIGDTVNTAQRLQSSASPSQIVINENSFNKINETFSCRKIGEVALKNKTEPMVLFEVLSKATPPSN